MIRHCQTVGAPVRCPETADCMVCRADIEWHSVKLQFDRANMLTNPSRADADRIAREHMAARMRAPEQADLL
jgi:hypothetical protein